jgi:hypothetical protein
MMMPTPIHHQTAYPNFMPGMASPLLMQAAAATGGQDQAASSGPPAAMAFTYVPIPVYNLGGMQMTGELLNNIPNVFLLFAVLRIRIRIRIRIRAFWIRIRIH